MSSDKAKASTPSQASYYTHTPMEPERLPLSAWQRDGALTKLTGITQLSTADLTPQERHRAERNYRFVKRWNALVRLFILLSFLWFYGPGLYVKLSNELYLRLHKQPSAPALSKPVYVPHAA